MYSRVVKVTKEIVKKGISVGICLAMLLPILPLNFSFIMNTEKEASAGTDYCTSKANANSWAHSDLRAWLNNGLAASVPDDGSAAPTGKNFKLDSTATSDDTSGYAKSVFSDDEWSKLEPITYYSDDGNGSYHKLTDKIVIPCSVEDIYKIGNRFLKTQPEGVSEETYSVPWNDSSYMDKHITCTPSSDPTKISGFNGWGEMNDIAVSDTGYVNPIIKLSLSRLSQIVCAPTLTELNNDGGIITRTLTKDSASSSARICFYEDSVSDMGYFPNAYIDENGRVGFGPGDNYKTCVAMAMKKNGNNIETITACSDAFDTGIYGYWIDFGKTKEELKDYVFYVWQESGSEKYARATFLTGAYWEGDSLKVDLYGGFTSSAFDGFKGIVYGNTMVGYQGTVPFGNRTWQPIGGNYFVQTQLERAVFNSSTAGYGATQTGITLSDELSNGIELTTTGSAVTIPTDGITLTGFPANTPISFHYRTQDDGGAWRDGTPQNAGTYYVMASADEIDYERKYSRAFPLTVKEIPVPKYTAPTTRIDAVWRDKAKDKLPSDLADYFGYPKTASGANIPGTWALVDENAEVGNVDGSNRLSGKFTPDPSVLDTYNWAGLSGWNATEGRLEVPALFTVAPMPADNIECVQVGYWGIKYDGTSKKGDSYWKIAVYNKNIGNIAEGRLVEGEDYDIEWPEDMTNVGTKTYTVVLKNNYTGTLTGTVGIVKREIKITADNQTIDYGEQLPQLTWQQSGDGFVLSDSLIEGTVAVEESGDYPGPGEYNIVPSGFSTSDPNNYEVSHVNGKLTINGPSADNVTMSLNQSSFPFNGRRQNLIVTVKDGNDILKENVHYALNIIGDLVNVGQGRAEVNLQAPYATRTLTKDWSITKRDVNVKIDDKCKVKGEDDPTFTYTVTAVDNGETIDGVDLTLTRDSGEDLGGSYTIRLASTSNSNVNIVNVTTGTLKIGTDIFEITPRDISNATVTVTPPSKQYTGGVHTPDVVLTDILNSVTKTLTLNTDYTLVWPSNMTNVGEKQGTITGKGNYTGTTNADYEITAVPTDNIILKYRLLTGEYTEANPWYEYDGHSVKADLKVFDGETELQKNSDYTIAWPEDTILPGIKTFTVTLNGKYGGKQVTGRYWIGINSEYGDKLLDILPQDPPFWPTYANGTKIPGEFRVVDGYKYSTKNPLVGDVTWVPGDSPDVDRATRLFNVGFWPEDENGRTYLTSINNINTDGSGNIVYRPIEVPVMVLRKTLTDDMLTMKESGAYTGSEITPAITIKNGDTTLALGTDYTVSYEGDRVNVGSFKVKITGQGNYKGSIEDTYTITAPTSGNVAVTLNKESFTYNGSNQTPTVTKVTFNEAEVPSSEYTANIPTTSTNADTYTVTVTLSSNYGSKIGTATYTINRKPVTVTAANKSQVYGEAAETLTYNSEGVVAGDTLNGDLTRASGNNVGTYDINQGTVTNATNSNYDITYVKGTYTITAAPITDSAVALSSSSFTYDGNEKKPTVTVIVGGRTLTADTDYTIVWPTNPVDVSNSYAIKVTGKGNYSGTVTKTYAITAPTSGNVGVTLSKGSFTYNGSKQTPTVTKVTFNGAEVPSSEYTASIPTTSTNADTYTVTVTLSSNYGSKTGTATYTIDRKPVTVTAANKSQVYGEAAQTLTYTTNTGDTLNGDLTRASGNNVGTYDINQGTVTNANNLNYDITYVKGTYTITAAPITDSAVALSSSSFTYDGSEQKPTVTVTVGERTLTVDTDYTIVWPTNPVDVSSSYSITVTGKGNYSGTVTKTYAITRKAVSDSTTDSKLGVTTGSTTFTYNGSPQELGVQITYNGETLQEGVDYTKSYTDASGGNDITNQGTKTLRVTFIKNLDGTITRTYTINPLSITDSKVSFALDPASAVFTGSALTTEAKGTVTFSGTRKDLVKGTDFEFNCPSDLINKGDYTLTITGKGNYSGTLNKTFSITAASSDDGNISADLDNAEVTYNGGDQKVGVTVKEKVGSGTRTLQENVDYTKSYTDASGGNDLTNVGTKTVTITLKGNYSGTITKTYMITAAPITDSAVTLSSSSFTYDGSEQKPTVTVTVGERTLTVDTDYTIVWPTNPVDVSSSYSITVTGKGNYSGTVTKTYAITRKSVSDSTTDNKLGVTTGSTTFTYNGSPQKLGVQITYNGETLQENVDYTKSYTDASGGNDITNQGTKTLRVTFIKNLNGTITRPYTINPLSITDSKVSFTLDPASAVFTGSALTTEAKGTVTFGGTRKDLVKGTDFEFSCPSNLINKDDYTLTITGKGNYSGTLNKTFSITAASSDDGNISADLDNAEVTYNGGDQKVGVTVKEKVGSETRTLRENVDYTKSYTDASGGNDLTNVGTKTVTITLQGNYSGTITKTYMITAAPITASDVALSYENVTYDGNAHPQTPTVTVGGRRLTVNTDYTVSGDTNPTNASDSYSITVSGKGNYSGTVTKTYAITKKSVSDSTTDNKLGVTTGSTTFTYNGSPQKLGVQITYNGETLQENVDYTKSYTDASGGNDITNQGTKTLRVTFIKNLNGTVTRPYTIERAPITENDVELSYESLTYDGNAHPQTPTVTVGGRKLTVNKDYTVNGDTNPTNVSNSYKITIAGQGNYSGTVTKTFAINKKEVTDSKPNGITMSVKPVEGKVFNGQSQTPDEVTLKDGAKPLIENVDYKLIYPENMINEGEYTITADFNAIEGGNYTGSITATFTITPKQISDNTPESELKVDVDKTGYTDETGYTYDKTPKRPAVTIKAMFGNRTMPLVQGTHFDVSYLADDDGTDPNNVTDVGPKKVVITFKNGFSGTKTIKYAINRRDVTIRPENRSKKYKAPDPDMRPRIDYDIINGLIAGDNLYGSFEREDPTNEEVGRYKLIQGTTLTNANNPNYNIIFDAENSGYFIIEVDKSSWGTPQDDPKDHYVDDEGKTSVEVDKYGMVWLKETSDGTSAWYGIDNSKGVFRIGSRFWVMWLSEKENPETYKKYWDMLDEDHKRAMESINGWIFLIGVTDPDGEEYEKFSENEAGETDEEKVVPTYVQIGDDWDEDELVGVFISETEDEDIETTFVDNFEFPEGFDTFGKMMLRHFSPYFIYDEFTDEERRALEGNNDDETNVLRTTVDIKGKTVQIIVSGPRRVLPEGTRLIAVVDSRDNTCKMWLVDQSGKELSSPLSERVEVFIEMVDGMEDLIEVRLPKIGEDFHYGKFDGSWYGAIYTPYFPISLSLDELTDAEKDELNKKRGINGESVEGSGSDGASGDSRNGQRNGSNVENDGQGDNETEEIQPAENGSSNWWQNLSQYQIICITAAGILLLLLLIFLILLILKRRKEKENSSQK